MVAKRKLSDTEDSSYSDGSGARSSSSNNSPTHTTNNNRVNSYKSRRTTYLLPPLKLSPPISSCRSTLTGSSGSSTSSSRKTSGNSEYLPSVKEVIERQVREEGVEPVGLTPQKNTFPPQHNYYPHCYQQHQLPEFAQHLTPIHQMNFSQSSSFSPVLSSTPQSPPSESAYSSSSSSNSNNNGSRSSQDNNAATPNETIAPEEGVETAVSENTSSTESGRTDDESDNGNINNVKLRGGPPAFHYALYNVISNPANKKRINWYRADEAVDTWSFQVLDWDWVIDALKEQGMRATKRPSITKNLSDYKFEKLSDGRKRIANMDGKVWSKYFHPCFQPGRHDLLGRITRKTK